MQLELYVKHMNNYPEIKNFVQKTLGCACPEEVFNKIDYQQASGGIWKKKINVGDRLLIYIIAMNDKSDIRELISTALKQGVIERNNAGLNRFRMVLVSSHPERIRDSAEQAFINSQYADEKTHLHIVSEKEVENF